jgi:gas vesicle protein
MLRFLIGISLGIVAGLLFAPASGEETRRLISERAEEMKERGIEYGRQRSRQLGAEAGEKAFDRVVGEKTERSA